MPNYSITCELAFFTAKMDDWGGIHCVVARLLNSGLIVTAALDALNNLGQTLLESVSLSLSFLSQKRSAESNWKISLKIIFELLVQTISHLFYLILTPVAIFKPQIYLNYCFASEKARKLKKEFYHDFRAQILEAQIALNEDEIKKVCKNAYKDLVKFPITRESGVKIRKPALGGQSSIEAIMTFADKVLIIQTNKILGVGSYKKVLDGHRFSFAPTLLGILKIQRAAVAIIRVQRKTEMAMRENEVTEIFKSRKKSGKAVKLKPHSNIVNKCERAFFDNDEWIMVNKKLPFFFDELMPIVKNGYTYNENVGFEPLDPAKEYPKARYSFKELIRALKGIAKALAEIHDKGYIHRDIKPENIGIQDNGKGIVIDLGFLIKNFAPQTFACSAPFSAPETVLDSFYWKRYSQTAETDLWALGIALFVLFHPKHRYPIFPGANKNQLRSALCHVKMNYSAFREDLFKDWPIDKKTDPARAMLQTLIGKLLSLDPFQRGTALEAAKELKIIESIA